MGAAASVNKLSQSISDSVSLSSSLSQSACDGTGTVASNTLSLNNCTWDSDVIDMSALVTTTCLTNMVAQMTTTNASDLTTQIKQAANTSTSGIPGFSATVSVDVDGLSTDISNQIQSSLTQTCGDLTTTSATNSITCTDSGVSNTVMDFKAVATAATTCVMNAVANSSSAQTLFTAVDQAATSTQTGMLGGITGIIILAIIVVGAVAAYKALNSKGGQQALVLASQQMGGAKPPGAAAAEPAAAAKGGCGGVSPAIGGDCGCGGPAAATGGDGGGGGGPSALAAFFSPTKLFLGGALLCVVMFVFYTQKWWPFQPLLPVSTTPKGATPVTPTADTAKAQQDAASARNKKILIGTIIAFVVCVLGAIVTGIILPGGKFVAANPQLLML